MAASLPCSTLLHRLIATHYLLDVAESTYCPQTWEVPQFWPSRMMYTVFRDAIQWSNRACAVEAHLFWQHACTVIDPNDLLLPHAIIQPNPNSANSRPIRLSPYQHFRNITNCSCYVCRVNQPWQNRGLASYKRTVHTYWLGAVPSCREHRKATFCGLCLRESPPMEFEEQYNAVSCAENEDEETWPGIEATCKTCRAEWLWQRASGSPRDQAAVGGSKFSTSDWETRQAIDAFIELGEGTITEVLGLAQDKFWLRKYTKLHDMLQQAIAASRYASREDGYSSADELSEEEEDDPELLSITEEAGGVRDLAINDFARNRILDGYWFSPADQWYGHTVGDRSPVVRATHPCPWSLDQDEDDGSLRPRPATVRAETPPSFQLCEAVYRAYQKQMRIVLLPAMNNIVRKLVIECTADRVDPALKASRMDLEDVCAALRDESMWYNGIDWLERRANKKRDERVRLRREEEEDRESSASSKSDDSHATSPVLSTSTLGTTPSPPPIATKKDEEGDAPLQVPIPVSPVLDRPRLLHPIPYIPMTTSHMPPYSQEALRVVWREACQPLYQCRCKICERAMVKANVEAGNLIASELQAQQAVSNTKEETDDQQTPGEIRIEDADEEIRLLEEEEEEEVEELEEEESSTTTTEDVMVYPVTPRKRSRDLEEDAEGESDHSGEEDDTERSRTPPKRVRREGSYAALVATPRIRLTAVKKRGSEEPASRSASRESGKRMRMEKELEEEESEEDSATSPPGSVVPSAEEDFMDDGRLSVTPGLVASPSHIPRGGRKAPSISDDSDSVMDALIPSVPGLAIANVESGNGISK
ncbi:hypothetical protein OE88DRAFT_1659834 [Heliocybe sulcata]|uniref:Uncharacterized protein n=1 Tax=Heliocybe sulcata TaxID=5364 RepID=A0A5C3MZL4_9AGAM|nr:hypothetical protein OE88DRAFT_1659834 [Heliocybe sulcata]